jgi:hypothetical protein
MPTKGEAIRVFDHTNIKVPEEQKQAYKALLAKTS